MVLATYSIDCFSYFVYASYPELPTIDIMTNIRLKSPWWYAAIMHQSIPAVPISPTPLPIPGNRGAFAEVVSPGGGAFAILSRPGAWALANPGDPGHLTHVFSSLSEKMRPSLKTGLSVTDSKNLWMLLKVCFLNFRYFSFILVSIWIYKSDKVN